MKCYATPFPVQTAYYTGNAILMLSRYQSDNRLAVVLINPVTYELMMKVSANIEGSGLGPDEICVKDYSENRGVLASLVAHGLVEETGKTVPSGYVDFPVVRMTRKALTP